MRLLCSHKLFDRFQLSYLFAASFGELTRWRRDPTVLHKMEEVFSSVTFPPIIRYEKSIHNESDAINVFVLEIARDVFRSSAKWSQNCISSVNRSGPIFPGRLVSASHKKYNVSRTKLSRLRIVAYCLNIASAGVSSLIHSPKLLAYRLWIESGFSLEAIDTIFIKSQNCATGIALRKRYLVICGEFSLAFFLIRLNMPTPSPARRCR
jgi:hypothetical protein